MDINTLRKSCIAKIQNLTQIHPRSRHRHFDDNDNNIFGECVRVEIWTNVGYIDIGPVKGYPAPNSIYRALKGMPGIKRVSVTCL